MNDDGDNETLTVPLHKELDLGTIQAVYRQVARLIPEAESRLWSYRGRAQGDTTCIQI